MAITITIVSNCGTKDFTAATTCLWPELLNTIVAEHNHHRPTSPTKRKIGKGRLWLLQAAGIATSTENQKRWSESTTSPIELLPLHAIPCTAAYIKPYGIEVLYSSTSQDAHCRAALWISQGSSFSTMESIDCAATIHPVVLKPHTAQIMCDPVTQKI